MPTRSGSVLRTIHPVGIAILTALVMATATQRAVRADTVIGTGTVLSCTEAALNTAVAGGGNITFNCGTSKLTITITGQKTIGTNTHIDGGGLITLTGGRATRVFVVNTGATLALFNLSISYGGSPAAAGAILNNGTLTVTDSTFANNGDASIAGGGAIDNERGTLTVTNSTFANNTADYGGAIYNSSGSTLTVTHCTFSGTGGYRGGAIYNGSVRTMTVTGSNFAHNGAQYGGVIDNAGGTLVVTGSTFSGNGVSDGYGGVIDNEGVRTLIVTDSTFSSNTGNNGGVISNEGGGTLTFTHSTFSYNSATDGGAIFNGGTVVVTGSTFDSNNSLYGGAIDNLGMLSLTVSTSTFSGNSSDSGGAISNGGVLSVVNSTFAKNKSRTAAGGAIFSHSGGSVRSTVTNCAFFENGNAAINSESGTLTLTNTIVANTTASENCHQVFSVTDGGHNLDSGSTCRFGTAKGSLSNIDPLLDPAALRNNGGPTQTIALLAGSPAINAGDESICSAPPVDNLDQRSYVRPGTGAASCSIGAYEYNPPLPTPTSTSTVTVTATYTRTSTSTGTPSNTPTNAPTVPLTATLTATSTNTLTQTPTMTPVATITHTPTQTVSPTSTLRPCVGDCNGSNQVTIDELIIMVHIALDNAQPPVCPHGVPSGAEVDIALIIQAVNNALTGCGGG